MTGVMTDRGLLWLIDRLQDLVDWLTDLVKRRQAARCRRNYRR